MKTRMYVHFFSFILLFLIYIYIQMLIHLISFNGKFMYKIWYMKLILPFFGENKGRIYIKLNLNTLNSAQCIACYIYNMRGILFCKIHVIWVKVHIKHLINSFSNTCYHFSENKEIANLFIYIIITYFFLCLVRRTFIFLCILGPKYFL